MPRIVSATVAWLGLLFFAGAMPLAMGPEQRALPKPGVMFTGKELPRPPHAGKEWSAPESSLPETWVSAVRHLLAYGFADPRGCEYREVEVTCGSVWSNQGVLVPTHAWVLPRHETDPPDAVRFAVMWSGLVYPVASIGAPADLRSDVERQMKTQVGSWDAHSEQSQVSHERPHPLKGCLLLVLGEADLAKEMWKVAEPNFQAGRVTKPADPKSDPYFGLVRDWAWAHFDRAVCARLRGDDVVSLASAKTLVGLRDAVEKEAPARGFERPLASGKEIPSYLGFLDAIPVVAEDQARRVAAKPVERVLAPGAAPIADPATRIAALIRDLEIVDVTQRSQPGGVWLPESPIVQTLIREGHSAVEPLLDCLEQDRRLVRTVSFGRDFHPHRNFLTVNEAALAALQGILKTQTFGSKSEYQFHFRFPRGEEAARQVEDVRRAAVNEIRDFYQKTKDRTDAERWYFMLSNDEGNEEQWLEAAQNLVQPARPMPKLTAKPSDAEQDPPLPGEPLRDRRNPSVSELLAKRADHLTTLHLNNTKQIHHLQAACRITLCLVKWDRPASLPELRRRIQQCRALERDPNYRPYTSQLHGTVSRLIIAAVDAGADELIDEYVAWMTDLAPNPRSLDSGLEMFQPLSRYPDDPKLAGLAKTLFSPGSLWLPLHQRLGHRWDRLLTSPLIGVPAFRELLNTQLEDRTPYGTATLDPEKSMINLQISGGRRSQLVRTAFDPDEPHLADPKVTRICDFTAWRLSHLPGAPLFELWWSEASRNAVLPHMTKFLEQWGNAFRESGGSTKKSVGSFETVKFRLTKLDRPATMADVAEGRAIFSLQHTGGEVRIVAMPDLSQVARWKTLTRFPVQTSGPADPATGKPTRMKSFDQMGSIWQAEEVLVDGVWKRYYGFVGTHIITQVPGDEIEFVE